jgi:beta-lactam-binding protein with PASTA domain/tRNA A-37 threonylcarbamoyl transferase component Bud32
MPGIASSDLLPGRVLSGRYLLHSAIGSGASGRVYVADDKRLRRRVAVKVLHSALADDAAFLRRFRAEAQLAASLRHANIVTVYDWGQDDVPFMVLELLEGGSLRSMLDRGTLLTVAQAARVGRDVASALEYAHARDVLHRDVKPANLLFDEHGVVRVADFGLARALAEASWTEPAGGMLGTARYASPEQASGLQLDARSDLYSLGLVLVEAVTGRVPFSADTTIGMLTARTQRALVAPQELGSLAPVVDRAGRLDPDDRYPDAGTMRQALTDVGDTLPPPGPLVLAGMVDHADPHPTRVAAPSAPRLFDQDAAELPEQPTAPTPRVKAARDTVGKPKATGRRRLVPWVVAAVILVVVALAATAFAQIGGAAPSSMPGFVGRTEGDARQVAREAGLSVEVTRLASPDPAGVVISQSPGSGAWTSTGTVALGVSSGPTKVQVPNLQGQPWKNAQPQLDQIGFAYKVKHDWNDQFPKGDVVSVTPPPPAKLAPDASITVVVSDGHAPVNVPDITGMSFPDAVNALAAVNLKAEKITDVFSNDVPRGKVASTIPGVGQPAPYQSTVQIQLSHGPIMTKVPNLLGLSLNEASAKLGDVGLALDINGHVRDGDVVVAQDPEPNARVPLETTTVHLTFDRPGNGNGR